MSISRAKLASNIVDKLEEENKYDIAEVIAKTLLLDNRTNELPSLMRDVSSIRAKKDRIVELNVVSFRALSDEQLSMVEGYIQELIPKAEKIIINNQVNESVVGSIRLEFPNRRIDFTVDSKIKKLRRLIRR